MNLLRPWRARPPAGAGRSDRGSGTVLVLGLLGVVVALAGLVVLVGAVVVARHHAESAADLAALAAAGSDGLDGPDPVPAGVTLGGTGAGTGPGGPGCRRAEAVATAGGGSLASCRRLDDGSYVVRVVVPVTVTSSLLPAVGDLRATARARAGLPPIG